MSALSLIVQCSKQAFKEELAYPSNIVGYISAYCFFFFIQYLFLGQIFSWAPFLAGWTEYEVKFIFILMVASQLCVESFSASVYQVFRLLTKGRLEPLLVKPMGWVTLVFVRFSKPSHLILGLALLGWAFLGNRANLNGDYVLLALVIFAVGVLNHLSFIVFLSVLTVFSERELPIDYIHSEVGRLSLIPIDLFGKKSVYCLLVSIPMIFTATLPASLLFKAQFQYVGVFFGVSAITLFLSYRWLIWSFRSFDGLGG